MLQIQTFNPPSLLLLFQSQTEDNPGSKMDLSVGVYHSTNMNGYIVINDVILKKKNDVILDPCSAWVGMGAIQQT